MRKQHMRAGVIETSDSGTNHTVLLAKSDRWCLAPIKTCNSGPNAAVLHAKAADEGRDP